MKIISLMWIVLIGALLAPTAGFAEQVALTGEMLRNGIRRRQPVMVEILNYKKDGTPFTMLERIWMAITVFFGGNETTRSSLAACTTARQPRLSESWSSVGNVCSSERRSR